jgi:hypothetical protein
MTRRGFCDYERLRRERSPSGKDVSYAPSIMELVYIKLTTYMGPEEALYSFSTDDYFLAKPEHMGIALSEASAIHTIYQGRHAARMRTRED